MSEKHKDWDQEQKRVQMVIEEIDRQHVRLAKKTGDLKEDVIQLREEFFSEETRVNVEEPHELLETHYSIKQQAELLSERERSHREYSKRLKALKRLRSSPYFGRIDFVEQGSSHAEPIYIGVASLMDEKQEDFLVYDWRAPISSMYYDYSPGSAEYETPGEGTVKGEMTLKRQYIIRNGQLKGMFDTGITIGDQLLQAVLGKHADTSMKSIVATIQKEQNQIIRNESAKYLFVQGVAGSGKTSAALQRVAYLLYRFRGKMTSENIMLFSPNPLFSSYIATVLPELGEENMEQTTFQDYLDDRLGEKWMVQSPFDQTEYLLNGPVDERYQIRMSSIRYKASLHFKQLLDRYISILKEKGMIFRSLTFRGRVIVDRTDIKHYFYSLDHSKSIPNRLEHVQTWLFGKLKNWMEQEKNKEWVDEEMETMDKEELLHLDRKLEKQGWQNDYDVQREKYAEYILKRATRGVKKEIEQLHFVDVRRIYARLFTISLTDRKEDYHLPDIWKEIGEETIKRLKYREMPYEDATPYLYLYDTITGRKMNTAVRHLVIDEAQDYSPFQMEYFKALFPRAAMTILGDVNQAIQAHSLDGDSLLSHDWSEDSGIEKITLSRSYRSTKQIVEFTRHLIPEAKREIQPFHRDGIKPTLAKVKQGYAHREAVVERMKNLKNKGYETIAVITKTKKEGQKVHAILSEYMDVQFIDISTRKYEKGIVVVPTYLAKGIEFDAVIIYDSSNRQYHREYERKFFYTACTRAMHELHLFTSGQPSRFLDDVPENSYDVMDYRPLTYSD